MKDTALFSVVIPSYNRSDELVRAVESALAQGEFVEEVIVVDDCSDNIREIEASLFKIGSDKIKLIKNEIKSNAAATRNQGARNSKAKWVAFLDSDDCFLPGKLYNVSKEIEKTNSKSNGLVFYNRASIYFNNERERDVPSRGLMLDEHVSDYLFFHKEMMQTSMLVVPRHFFCESGFNESYVRHQDYDLVLSLFEKGYRFQYVDFVGTAIFWNGKERPTDKGESVSYSKKWALENRNRFTCRAFSRFYFQFVVLKSCRQGDRKTAILECLDLSGKKFVAIKSYCLALALLLLPKALLNPLYRIYKAL